MTMQCLAILALAVLCLGAAPFAHADAVLSKNLMPLIDGQPHMLLGLYENPKDDATLKQVAEAGFDVVQCQPAREELDRVARLGLKAWVNLGGNLDLSRDTDTRKAALAKMVNELKDHPALLMWEIPDEALWNVWYGDRTCYLGEVELPAMIEAGKAAGKQAEVEACIDLFKRGLWKQFDARRPEVWALLGQKPAQPDVKMADWLDDVKRLGDGITAGIEYVRSLDPKHAIWLNHAPRNSIRSLKYFNRAGDMAGCDIYPVPNEGHTDFFAQTPAAVGAYTLRMREAAPGKACAMVLQGFGWRDIIPSRKQKPAEIGRRPLFQETRFMAYDAVVNGANAVLYWGTMAIEKDSQLWKDLMVVTHEIKSLNAFLATPSLRAPKIVIEETGASHDGKGAVSMLKKSGDDYLLVVANEIPSQAPFNLTGLPRKLEGKTLYRLGTSESVQVQKGGFSDGIRPYDVHVYTTDKALVTKP